MPGRLTRLRTREHAGAALLVALFTAAPFAAFLQRNRDEISSVSTVIRLGLLTEVAALMVLTVAVVATRRAHPASVGAVVAAMSFLFFQWSWFVHGPVAVQYALWLAATAAAAWAAALLTRSANGRLFLVLLGAGLLAGPSVSYLSWRAGTPDHDARSGRQPTPSASSPASASSPGRAAAPPAGSDLPDVYLFVLDGYGRADQLESVLGYDDSAFLAALEERGFEVRDDAFSSYPATYLSITSILEMDHVATRASDLDGGHRNYYPRLQGDNAAVRAFHDRGYAYVHAESGTYDGTKCGGPAVDVCIPAADDSHGFALDEVEFSLMRLTPARPLLDAGIMPLGDRYTDPERVAGQAADLRSRTDGPWFLFAHVVAPHAPFRRRSDCSHRSRNVGVIGEGWEPGMRDDYLAALQCAQRQMLAAIDSILRGDPDSFLVLTGDHGTAFNVDFEQPLDVWTTGQIEERYSVFHATRLPDRCGTGDPAAANIVNSLRTVVACIDGRPPDLLQPRAFLYRYGEHEVVEIDDLAPMTVAGAHE